MRDARGSLAANIYLSAGHKIKGESPLTQGQVLQAKELVASRQPLQKTVYTLNSHSMLMAMKRQIWVDQVKLREDVN